MAPSPEDPVAKAASQLAASGISDHSVEALLAAAGGDRQALERARNQVASRLRAVSDDWEATAALTLLNRALASMPRPDPLDWRVRWSQRFRKP